MMPSVELIRAYSAGSDWLALFDEPLILGMCSDSKPNKIIAAYRRQCPHPRVHASRPKFADFLEIQGRMRRIGLQKGELVIGLLTRLSP
jgi:hypothetical protein